MAHQENMNLQLAEADSGSGGCGCGGCGCGSSDAAAVAREVAPGRQTQAFSVAGMTCGHCASAVTKELEVLPGVTDVYVALVPGGITTVTVVSDPPLDQAAVAVALAEAGDYQLT